MMVLGALTMAAFGLFLLLVAIVLLTGQQRSRRQLGLLRSQVDRVTEELRTEEERAELARRTEAFEARQREIHGLFDSGGC